MEDKIIIKKNPIVSLKYENIMGEIKFEQSD